jgi:hypothetical protein
MKKYKETLKEIMIPIMIVVLSIISLASCTKPETVEPKEETKDIVKLDTLYVELLDKVFESDSDCWGAYNSYYGDGVTMTELGDERFMYTVEEGGYLVVGYYLEYDCMVSISPEAPDYNYPKLLVNGDTICNYDMSVDFRFKDGVVKKNTYESALDE